MSEQDRDAFAENLKRFYLDPRRPTLMRCYERSAAIAVKEKREFPSYSTARRMIAGMTRKVA